jgi:hypothetical protein
MSKTIIFLDPSTSVVWKLGTLMMAPSTKSPEVCMAMSLVAKAAGTVVCRSVTVPVNRFVCSPVTFRSETCTRLKLFTGAHVRIWEP